MENENKSPGRGATLTPVSPSDLKVGEKYFIEVELKQIDDSDKPYFVRDVAGQEGWTEPIPLLTLTPSSEPDNDRLKMVVEVASRMLIADTHYSALEIESELGHNLSEDSQERSKQWASAYKRLVAREALELITACENELNKQS